ncbi:ribonuclease P protein component [Methylotenera versatilis]|uniref:ribonuclease P protein component n=1 Tax=Methylotenera versatilis TaxID=1055487 RepID=UPI000647AE9C|nr:ribonuclease P protein component [Methylotenera versatilis]
MVMFSLPKQAKLIKTDDFSSVFNLRKRIASPYLVMRFKPNLLNRPRLGLIVAKKTAKLAVKRNYMRRVLRELFRLNQHNLPSIDLVIQAQKTFEKTDFNQVKQEFEQLMLKLIAKNTENSSKNTVKTDV